jgi:EAL domain-containing protein (putative c-di-GMP-specific phosphodiesterase class I)
MNPPFDPDLYEQELRHGHRRLRDARGARAVEVEGLSLGSRFEPLYSRAHGRPVGHRGVLEVWSGTEQLSPDRASAEFVARGCTERVPALAAGLHMTNYDAFATAQDRGWLLLSLPDAVVQHPQLWPPLPQDLFSSAGYAPHHLVLEIRAEAAGIERVADFVRYHRELGFAVALSEFGLRQTDLSRVWGTLPDIVSVSPRGLAANSGERFPRVLGALARVLHECGAMVAVRDVDDEEMLTKVLGTDADLLEGASAGLVTDTTLSQPASGDLTELRERVARCSDAIADGAVFEAACERLLGHEAVLRCYLLDAQGTQLTDNLSRIGTRSDARFWPLANAVGACWAHRPYFRSAFAHPGQVMATEPYFSLPDGHHCVTLAIAFEADDAQLVLCCDLSEVAAR